MNSTGGNNNNIAIKDDINPVQTEEYYYDEEDDDHENPLDGGIVDNISPSRNNKNINKNNYDFKDFGDDENHNLRNQNNNNQYLYKTNPKNIDNNNN